MNDMLRFYFEVARTAFRRQLIYRWANLAGLFANVFWGAILSYIMLALFHVRPVTAGYNVQDAVRYIWLMQSMTMVVVTFGWYDLMLTIRTGEVISDLSKPCDFYWYWFSREMGRAGYYLLFRGVPTYLMGIVFFGIGVLADWRLWLAYLMSLLLGAMMGVAYRILYNIFAFWTIEARAVGVLIANMALFFTGSFVPVPFFPAWLRAVTVWLPFNGFMNVPASIFNNKLMGGELLFELGRQVFWVVVLTLVVRTITSVATRRVIVQGG